MDMFTRFNRKNIEDRQVDTLIGISKGLIADGSVNQAEAESLHTCLAQAQQNTNNPIIINLLYQIDGMLADGVLDKEESQEVLSILRKIAGDESVLGELAKTTGLPIDQPEPTLEFQGKSFLFTGTCAFGTRTKCQSAISNLGGINAKSVTKSLDYLVLGTYVTDSWVHETFGRKIEKAMAYRDKGQSLIIVTEQHWADQAGL